MQTKSKVAISALILPVNYNFLEKEIKKNKQTKSSLINHSLELYRKIKLKKEMEAWFSSQTKSDLDLAEEMFDDFNLVVWQWT